MDNFQKILNESLFSETRMNKDEIIKWLQEVRPTVDPTNRGFTIAKVIGKKPDADYSNVDIFISRVDPNKIDPNTGKSEVKLLRLDFSLGKDEVVKAINDFMGDKNPELGESAEDMDLEGMDAYLGIVAHTGVQMPTGGQRVGYGIVVLSLDDPLYQPESVPGAPKEPSTLQKKLEKMDWGAMGIQDPNAPAKTAGEAWKSPKKPRMSEKVPEKKPGEAGDEWAREAGLL